ncbi:unnamed protein product [Caretta caretta]
MRKAYSLPWTKLLGTGSGGIPKHLSVLPPPSSQLQPPKPLLIPPAPPPGWQQQTQAGSPLPNLLPPPREHPQAAKRARGRKRASGVQQGCPLASQLYTIATEPFLHLLYKRMTGLVQQQPDLWLVLSMNANNMLLIGPGPGRPGMGGGLPSHPFSSLLCLGQLGPELWPDSRRQVAGKLSSAYTSEHLLGQGSLPAQRGYVPFCY